jgi:hypothetical protein
MDPIEVSLTTPSIRLEDLERLLIESAKSALAQIQSVDPTEYHRYKTVVSVEQIED